MESRTNLGKVKDMIVIGAFFIAFVIGGELGHWLSADPGHFATFWPNSGLYLAVLLRTPRGQWWKISLAAVSANLCSDVVLHGQPWPIGFAFASANALEAIVGAELARRFISQEIEWNRLGVAFRLVAIAALVSCAIGGFLGALTISFWYELPFLATWRTWWTADVLGILLVTPVILHFASRDIAITKAMFLEGTAMVACLIPCTIFVFHRESTIPPSILFLILLWAAMRLGIGGVSLASFGLAVITIKETISGYGVYALSGDPMERVTSAQIFAGVSTLLFHAFALVLEERKRIERRLEDEVRQRTIALASERDLLAITLQSVDDGILCVDNEGIVLRLNTVAEQIIERPASEVVGKKLSDVVRWLDFPSRRPLRSQEFLHDHDCHQERTSNRSILVGRDGVERHVEDCVSPLRANGLLIGSVIAFRDITQRLQIEEERQTIQERLLRFVEQAPAAIAMFDDQLKFLAVSRRWLNEVSLGSQMERGRLPESWRSVHEKVLTGKVIVVNEDCLNPGDAAETWISWEARPWTDSQGTIRGVVMFAEDITARKTAEDRLRHSEERFRLAAEAVKGLIYEVDLSTGAVERSLGLFELVGFHPDEVPSNSQWWWDRIHPDDRVSLGNLDWKDPSAKIACSTYRVQHREGHWLYVEDRAIVCQDPSGKAVKLIGCTVDVTRQVLHNAELKRERDQLAFIVETCGIGVWINPLPLSDLHWNNQVKKHFFLSPEDPSPSIQEYYDRIHVEDRESVANAIENAIQRRAIFDQEHRTVCPKTGNQKWIRAVGRATYSDDGEPTHFTGITLDITQLRSAAESERSHRRQLELITDNAPVLLAQCDREQRYRFVNREYARTMGMEPEEIIGKKIEEVMDPLAYADALPHLEAALNGAQVEFELELPMKDGRQPRFLRVAYQPERNDQGELVGLIAAISDITESMAQKAALDSSEVRFQQLADAMPQIVYISNVRGQAEYLNKQWEAFTGLAQADLIRAVHPDDLKGLVERWRVARRQEIDLDAEFRLKSRDGDYRWFLTRAVPIRDRSGNLVNWFGTSTEIQAQKQAEEAAMTRVRQAKSLAAAATRINAAPDVDSIIEVVTHEARQLLEAKAAFAFYSPDQSTGTATTSFSVNQEVVAEYCWSKDLEQKVAELVSAKRGPLHIEPDDLKDLHEGDGSAERSNDSLPKSIIAAPLLSRDGIALGTIGLLEKVSGEFHEEDLAMLVQLSQMSSVAIENARLMEDLREADRRKDEFLATLAHELRNPLAPIGNGLQLLRLATSNPETVRQAYSMMERQLDHMIRLIGDLMDLTRIRRGKFHLQRKAITIGAVLQSAIESCRPIIDARQHELQVSMPDFPIFVDGDMTRLSQVFANLLNNAAKYTNDGGRISVVGRAMQDEISITIEDNGIGIPEAMLPKIFEMFTQVDRSLERSQGGLGIGLNIVKNLVELHGGRITVESHGPQQGSKFSVILPTVHAPDFIPATNQLPAAKLLHRIKVMVVDDNRDSAISLSILLQAIGFETQLAHDGCEAVSKANIFQPDVILMDIGMPKLNGYDACRQIRQLVADQPLLMIAMTGWGQEEDRRKSRDAGFDHHLVKPIDHRQLVEIISQFEAGLDSQDNLKGREIQRVLIVDDRRDVSYMLATLLRLEGFEIEVAVDGQAALSTLANFQPQAVILDIGLPGMSGLEVAKKIRSEPRGHEILLVAVTGHDSDEDRCRSIDSGFDHHLTKPASIRELRTILGCAHRDGAI